MQRERLTQSLGGQILEADGLRLVLHADGSAELETSEGLAEFDPELLWSLVRALRAPGVAGLLSRAARARARRAYDEQRREAA
jgi:hypothetical protein